ncbi:MAG: outer membrane beta-barrel protein, partial [Bacteroidota bacterium]|nr:outer membrane beta-barrel protein [Bacteroidota bacterium]
MVVVTYPNQRLRMLNKNCILILFVFCNILAVNGQVPGPTKNNIPGTIKGKVVDLRTKSPLQYASLTLHKSTDSTQIAGSVSLKDGSFKLDKVTPGDYFLVAKYIGYKKETKKNIKITQNQHIAEIGTIPLNPDITLLEEVNVINSSNQIRQEINKKVLLIAPSMNNINHSAADILQTLPSIQVDPDGGVSLRGSSKFIILINGIPTVRGNGNALKQIPASDIQQIDVITSPSSEYDAEGSAGIINIILKKNRINGINGQVAVKGGNYDSQGLNMDLNYKTGKWNFHVETDYTGQSYKPNLNFERLFTSNTIQKIISGGEQNRHNREHYLTGNIEYTPDTLSTLSLMTEMGNGRYRMFFPLNYHESVSNPQNSENILEKRSRDDINMNRTWDYSSSTLNYSRHVTNNSELKITGYLSSLIYNRDEKQDETIEYLSTRSGVSTGEGNHFLERCNDREYLIKLEYSFPIATSFKLMSGIQNRGFRENQSYQPTQRNTGETLWTPVADNHNLSLFSRRVSSGYMQLTGEIASIDIEAGTRLEREFRKIRTDTGIDDNTAHLIDLFPSLHLSKQLSADINLQAGYNERINRPVSTWLLLSP